VLLQNARGDSKKDTDNTRQELICHYAQDETYLSSHMEPLVAMQGKMKQGHIFNGAALEQKDA